MSKVNVAIVAAAMALGTVWIENAHRVAIEAPVPVKLASQTPVAACPDNDKVPYSADCLTFLKGATETGMRWRIKAEERPAVAQAHTVGSTEPAPTAASACPANDSVPYSATCLAFLMGPGPADRPH